MENPVCESVFDSHVFELVDSAIEQVIALRKEQVKEPKIIGEVFGDWSDQDADSVFEMALARQQDEKEPRVMLPLFMIRDDLRFATHRFIAVHRARRLVCNTIIEVGCGIGSQTIEFAKACKKVIAIDIDPRRIAFAIANCQKMKLDNIEFVCADGVEALEGIEHADIVFCDPERAPESKERTIDAFSPSIMGLIDACSHKTSEVAIELPPHMKEIPINGELEYASIEGKLARLTLYRGELSNCSKSAVCLPKEDSLNNLMCGQNLDKTDEPNDYVYELDEAVAAADLADRIGLPGLSIINSPKPILLTSDNLLQSPFFRACFHRIAVVEKKEDLKPSLVSNNAGKAVIRYRISPADYWKERSMLEKGLNGERQFQIFSYSKGFLVGEKILFQSRNEPT